MQDEQNHLPLSHMSASSPPAAGLRFLTHPVTLCVVVALALTGIGDQYPFSPFPMYSDIGEDADVLFLTDQDGKLVPLSSVFGISSAQAKKQFKDSLYRASAGAGKTRNHDQASPEAIAAAARDFLEGMWERGYSKDTRRRKIEERGLTALTAKLMVVKLAADGELDTSDVSTLGTLTAADSGKGGQP